MYPYVQAFGLIPEAARTKLWQTAREKQASSNPTVCASTYACACSLAHLCVGGVCGMHISATVLM